MIQRECLAVVYALKQFLHYLLGRHFIVLTDHAPLQWLSAQKMEGMLGRWALVMQEFTFTIQYRRGKDNNNADSLSRQPHFYWILLQQSPGLTETAFVKANNGTQSLQKYILGFRPPRLAPCLLFGVVHPCLDTGSFGLNYQLWMALSLAHIGRVRHLCLSMFHWFLSPCRGIFSGSPMIRRRQVT